MDHKQRHRGRPRVIIGESVAASSMLPIATYDHWAKAALHDNTSVSAIIRDTLEAAKRAFEITPLLTKLQSDRDEAIRNGDEAIRISREALNLLHESVQRENNLVQIIELLREAVSTLPVDTTTCITIQRLTELGFSTLHVRRSGAA